MSDDGDASNRLSNGLDQLLSRSSGEASAAAEVGDTTSGIMSGAAPGAPSAEPYELPEIVPATEEHPRATSPTLPARLPVPETDPVGPAVPSAAPVPPPAAAATMTAAPTTSWSAHLTAASAGARGAGLRAPRRKPRVRRVTRVLRHIDPWSTFKLALLFSLVTYLVALTSGVLLWRVADSTGTLDNVERWFTQFGWETFELRGGEVFHNAWIIGLFGVVAMTGGLVLLATVFNLVSDIVGGIRLTVLEEEVVERTVSSTRRYVVRQGPAAAGVAAVPAQQWDVDDDVSDAPPGRGVQPPTQAPDHPAPAADWSVD